MPDPAPVMSDTVAPMAVVLRLPRSMPSRILLAIGLAGAAAYLAGLLLDLHALRLATKAVPVLCLIAWLAPFHDADHRRIEMGLCLSAVGDLLLEFEPAFFVPGLVAFLGAQVTYTVAFVARTRRPCPGRATGAALFGAVAFLWLAPALGALRMPVLAYVCAICLMLWRAWAQPGDPALSPRLATFAALGATSFVLSDLLVAYNRFVAPVLALQVLLMLLYWAAQWLIAASVNRGAEAPRAGAVSP
jgi:uncharacterized membrane protein YhhN